MKSRIGSTGIILLGIGTVVGTSIGLTTCVMAHIDTPNALTKKRALMFGVSGAAICTATLFAARAIGKVCVPPAINLLRDSINTFLGRKP